MKTDIVIKPCYLCDEDTTWKRGEVPKIPFCDWCVSKWCLGASEPVTIVVSFEPVADLTDMDYPTFKDREAQYLGHLVP